MGKTPKTMKKAIERTIELHQMVLDGKYEDYQTAKNEESIGECPLCLYADYRNSKNKHICSGCKICPWIKFQGYSCTHTSMSYYDSEESIERLNSWLNGKQYRRS